MNRVCLVGAGYISGVHAEALADVPPDRHRDATLLLLRVPRRRCCKSRSRYSAPIDDLMSKQPCRMLWTSRASGAATVLAHLFARSGKSNPMACRRFSIALTPNAIFGWRPVSAPTESMERAIAVRARTT